MNDKRSLPLYDIAPPLLLLFLTVIFFWRQLVLGESLYWGDIGLYFLPMQHFLHDQLHLGRLPLWNPYILCGAPYVGNPQTWALYPSSLLLFPMPAELAINATIALHIWLAGCGMFAFLKRTTGLRVPPCLFGAVVFMFGGQLVSKEQFPNMVQACAYAPWILLAIDRFVDLRTLWTATVLGAVVGLQVLAAHAQITLLCLYLGLAYGLFRLTAVEWHHLAGGRVERPLLRVKVFRLASLLVFAALIAFGLAACQTLPILELFTHAWRQRLTFKIVDRFYLPPNQLLNFTLPTLHGNPYFGDFTARGNFWETCCYVGWIPALSAWAAVCFAFVRERRRRLYRSAGLAAEQEHDRSHGAVAKVRFWSVVFVFGVWMATGGVGKIYRAAWAVLPGFRNFHDPARCLLWSAIALSILSAYGLHAVMRRLEPHHGTASTFFRNPAYIAACLAILVTFADLCRFGATLYPLAPVASVEATVPNGAVHRVLADSAVDNGEARVIAPDSARVWQRFTTHKSYRRLIPNYNALWRDTLTPNLSMDAGIMDAFGYEPETRLDAQRILGMIDADYRPDAPPRQRTVAASLSGLFGVRYVAMLRVNPPDTEIPHLASIYNQPALPLITGPADVPSRIYLTRDTAYQPRARLTTDFLGVPTHWDAVRAYEAYNSGDTGLDLSHVTLVAGNPGLPATEAPPTRSTPRSTVDIDDISPDRVDVTATASRPCLLVLADTLHPGWRATVDGRPADILSADGFVRAITLREPGRHVVSFLYKPTAFFAGLYLTLFTLSLVLAVGVRQWMATRIVTESRKWSGSRRTERANRFPISR